MTVTLKRRRRSLRVHAFLVEELARGGEAEALGLACGRFRVADLVDAGYLLAALFRCRACKRGAW